MAASKWDRRLLGLAEYVSRWSKDPSTQVGAVIADTFNRVVGVGFNGFPRGVADTPERLNNRDVKYQLVVHAERNAIHNATSSVAGCTMYVTLFPCSTCAGDIIQAGIARIVSPTPDEERLARWGESWRLSKQMLEEAGVVCHEC